MTTSGITSSVEVLKSTIDNRFVRFLLRRLTSKCEKDGKSRLGVALELFSGAREKGCFTCSHLALPIVRWAIGRGGSAFGVSGEDMKNRFKDPYWCTGLIDVIKGIAKYGIKKPFVPGAPFLIVWDYTNACNLKCKHCYASAGKPLPNELSSEEALRIADELADAGVTAVAFSGGEPLMRKDIFKTIKRLRDHGVYPAVASNGTLINKEMAKKLAKSGVGFVQISLDGANSNTHDSFRGIPGAYEETLLGIKNCVENDLFVEASTTATKLNYLEIPRIADLCEELGVDWYMIYNFVPTGRGNFITENDLSPEEREELLKTLWKRLRNGGKMQYLSTAPQFARVALQDENGSENRIIPGHFYNPVLADQLQNLGDFIGGCGAGRMYAGLEPDGTLKPCVFLPLKLGNLREQKLEEIWDSHPILKTLRDRTQLKGNCRKCQYREMCGGCRARAYGYFGDITAPDPGCINNTDAFEKIVEKEKEKEISI
ncbi:MAG: radical SAM protein [Candidatus Freyarchaeum deiterrae]